jgi:hypothetical protein
VLPVTWLTALAWAFALALALIDGWHRRFTPRFTGRDEYLHAVRRFGQHPGRVARLRPSQARLVEHAGLGTSAQRSASVRDAQ